MIVQAGTTFYDSASKQAPQNHPVAAYADGLYAYTVRELSVYPAHFLISVLGDPSAAQYARCLDIEKGDATVNEAAGFVWSRISHGHHDALLYVNRSNMPAVIDACSKDGLALGAHYHLWVATLDNTWHLPDMTGVAAIQGFHDPADRFDMSKTMIPMTLPDGHG